VSGVEGSDVIFNIVFFITIISLVVQGTTIPAVARRLGLSLPLEKEGNDFGIELPEDIDSVLTDFVVTKSVLKYAETLRDMRVPKGTLVMMIKRGEQILVPDGSMKLREGDKLLFISEKAKVTPK
jgi:cell volume regulation protein A